MIILAVKPRLVPSNTEGHFKSFDRHGVGARVMWS